MCGSSDPPLPETSARDLERRLHELERREALLDEAFLYQKQIDAKTYERQRDKVREEITLARIELERFTSR